jgi:hypothetical protein
MLSAHHHLLGVVLAPLLVGSVARGQELSPPDTLETPYPDAPVAPAPTSAPAPAPPAAPVGAPPAPHAPPAAPVPPAVPPAARPEKRASLPPRAERRLVLTGEVGWNGLAGFGPVLTFHAHPHLSFDLGAGISLVGGKVGVRTRYNLLSGPVTPFLGVGFMASTGWKNFVYDPSKQGEPDRNPITLNIKDSYFVQSVVGIDYIHRAGFSLIGSVGYARLLNHDNVEVVEGTPDEEDKKAFDILFRSGPVITVGVGYAFR